MRSPSLLVVEDDLRMRHLVRDILAGEGYAAEICSDSREAAQILKARKIDMVITDLMMPHLDGMQILERAKQTNPDCLVIVITGYGTIESAVEAIKKGAYDYVAKPFEPDQLLCIVRRATEHVRLLQENLRLRQQVAGGGGEELIGTSRPMEELKAFIAQVAPFDTTILIQGETGTGKEVVARMIHRRSIRRHQKFLPVNCGALPESLLESELFGHTQGAFTGAEREKPGLFESVDKGTILLDEINSTSAAFQVKLLRILEEGTFLKVGGRKQQKVDVRVIAASNSPLEKEVATGRFRRDLFYRLNVMTINIPSLRERRDDLPLLAQHFLARFGAKYGKPIHRISAAAQARLLDHDWPGNVRELENVLERAVLVADGLELQVGHLPRLVWSNDAAAAPDTTPVALAEMEKMMIAKVLQTTRGNKGKTAEILGISPVSLWRKIKKYGIA